MAKQAIIYTRFSPRPNAKDCDSCEKQEERCRAYCKQKSYKVIAIEEDKSESGGVLNRPALTKAITYLSHYENVILVVDSSDRLARDMLVNLTIRHQVEQAGATIEFADGSPTDTTPEGKLFQNILAAFAAYERDRIRLRTKQGLDRKRKNCERLGGEIPIGWKEDPEDPKRLIRCELERMAIIRACLHKHNGFTSKEIAHFLTCDICDCRGKPWSDRTVRMMIQRHAIWADPVDGIPELEPEHP